MRRIIYLCPADDSPVGGIKVIYRHVEALNRQGIPAFVLHPSTPGFRCSWFQCDVAVLDSPVLDPATDFVVIPEVWTLLFGPQCQQLNLRHAIFVQNGYMMYPQRDDDGALLAHTMQQADLVLSISHDTDQVIRLNFPNLDPARLVRVTYSVPSRFTAQETGLPGGETLVTFMPRKLACHAARVVYALRNYLPPGWRMKAIDKVDEATCAAMLGSSRIFLSFSDFEGLALPPLEAALAGNLVIGYTGQGNAEYWIFPNFQAIEQGNIIGFVRTVQAAAAQMQVGLFRRDVLQPGIARLTQRFSAAAEAQSLRAMVDRLPPRDGTAAPRRPGQPGIASAGFRPLDCPQDDAAALDRPLTSQDAS